MVTLEVVAHAWRYEKALAYHLSAFCLNPPKDCQLIATIFYNSDDQPVRETLSYFIDQRQLNVVWRFLPLSVEDLCRRAIGRQCAAKSTTADYIIFSDVDYLFGPGAIDATAAGLTAANANGPVICYAHIIQSSRDHAAGDAELARVDRPQIIAVDPSQYEPQRLPTAIGGSQMIPGELARRKGYLPDGHRFLRPATVWTRTWDDRSARGWWDTHIVALDIPNIYRIRHAKRGRTDVGCRN